MSEAAAVLSVHVNTLRYRLCPFAALTGADLQDTETMFEVWWALQHRTLRGSRSDSVQRRPAASRMAGTLPDFVLVSPGLCWYPIRRLRTL